jgi:type III pantothenate kinase
MRLQGDAGCGARFGATLTSCHSIDHVARFSPLDVRIRHARDLGYRPGNGRLEMLLVVDAGNTNIVFAVHDPSGWRGVWRIRTDAQRTSDEYAVWLNSLLTLSDLKRDQIHRAVIGTVVPAALYHLRRLCRDWFSVEPLIARATLDWGFEIKIDNPNEVGADRLLNAMAGHRNFGGPMIVVDFGTATTFDVVDKNGAYLGGVICPGINLSLEALHQAAARLPRIGIGRPQAVIGRSTVPAMQSGMYWGYVGLIEGLLTRIKAEFGGPMKVVATGGLAPLFAEGTLMIEHIEPDLTLDGLRMLAERNPAPTLPRERARLIEPE